MQYFSCRGRIQKVYPFNSKSLPSKGYVKCNIEVADVVITAYIKTSDKLEEGSFIESDKVCVTNVCEPNKYNILALLIEDYKVITEEEYEPMEHLEVVCEGVLQKKENATIRELSDSKRPFLPATIVILNERGKEFGLLIVSFYNKAKKLDKLSSGTSIRICARAKMNRKGDGTFELNITTIEVIE